MAYYETTATKKIKTLKKRVRAVAGGTSASKTISILLYLIAKCQTDTTPTLTSIVSESFPHLRRGVMRDFLNILQEHNYYDEERWSRTGFTYTFETGSTIEFFSADQSSKVRGPRRDRLFVNEGNNVSQETFEQLLIRTKEFAFIDWNPVAEFYIYTDYIGKRDDVDFIVLTYKDNEALDESIVKEIESRKKNKAWWRVYGEGQLGDVEGRIFKEWQIIDEIPHNARLVRRGLDFGYSIDPTSIVDVYEYDGGLILDEQLYQKGLSNSQIANFLQNIKDSTTLIIADSAEPKSIDELKLYGLNVIPTKKGKDSVNYGIQLMQDKRISITKSSLNGIKEYRNYLWKTDKDGKNVGVPEPGADHFLDAARYAVMSMVVGEQLHAFKPQLMVQRKNKRK
jgi:phage terminase large subunit